jgi:hypothetical protein
MSEARTDTVHSGPQGSGAAGEPDSAGAGRHRGAAASTASDDSAAAPHGRHRKPGATA